MSDDPAEVETERFDAADIAYLNREAMRDAAVWGRVVAIVLMVLGAVGALAWLWVEIRIQLNVHERSFSFGSGENEGGVALVERVDALANTVGLLLEAALLFGLGAALTLLSNHVTVKYGGTLSGHLEGDEIVTEDDPLDPGQVP